ncbi:homeobox protein OTX2-like [Psammomys obesus]|uniref:homeobox protein OTX2-like n=1 Tax=Psammomys obesus TaxID=48139 RepID=UPI00245327D7|nr:homeobox protein OTX2-like [Psammomys obesus]
MPSSSSEPSACQGSLGPMVPADKNYGDQHVCPVVPRKQRKERTVYTKEQKLMLQKYFFNKNKSPNREECRSLAELIGVTENAVQIWFKNQRAKNKKKNLQKFPEVQPRINGNSKEGNKSTGSPGPLSVVASANGESMSPGTFGVSSIPKHSSSHQSPLHGDQAYDDARNSLQGHLFDSQADLKPRLTQQ